MVRGARLSERLQRIAFSVTVVTVFAFIVAPIVLVVWLSFFSNEILALPPEGYSLRWYQAMLGQPQFRTGFSLSLLVAVSATAIGLLVTTPAAFALTRLAFAGREAVLQFLLSPLVVPAIVIGAALYLGLVEFEVQTEIPLTGSFWGLVLGHVLLTIPWSLRLITANLVGVDVAIEEAAASLGATPIETALKVTLPVITPGMVAAALFSFVVSFGNVELSLFLIAPGQTTLPIAILQYLQWKIDPMIAAVSTIQIALIASALLVSDRFVRLSKVL